MITAHDVCKYISGSYLICQPFGNKEVVDTPARVILSGLEAIRPPGVLYFGGMKMTEAIGKARTEKLLDLAPFLV